MITKHGRIEWIESNGGPLILLGRSVLSTWGGYARIQSGLTAGFRWRGGGPPTDYDRACDVNDYTGCIVVGSGRGLVLGDEPLMTTCVPAPEVNGILLARWVCAENHQAMRRHLSSLSDLHYQLTSEVIEMQDADQLLFDSAIPGNELTDDEALNIRIAPGIYAIDTSRFVPDATSELLVHRLRQVPSAIRSPG